MHVLLTDMNGRIREGILVAAGRSRMRIVLRRYSDTLDLHLTSGVWTSQRGHRFEIDAITADTDLAMSDLGDSLKAKTMTAGMQLPV
jgi:hypothetical protein